MFLFEVVQTGDSSHDSCTPLYYQGKGEEEEEKGSVPNFSLPTKRKIKSDFSLFWREKTRKCLRERKCFLVRKLQSLLEDGATVVRIFSLFCCRFVHFCAYYTTYCIRNDVLLAWIFFCLSKVPPRSRQKKEQIFHHAFSRKKKEKICFLWCEICRGRERKKTRKVSARKSFLCFF